MTDEVSEAYASDCLKRSISKCSYQPKKAGKDGYVMNISSLLWNYKEWLKTFCFLVKSRKTTNNVTFMLNANLNLAFYSVF